MKKLFILLMFLLSLSSFASQKEIDTDFCFTDIQLTEGIHAKSYRKLSCRNKEVITQIGKVGVFFLGQISVACSVMPDITVTKATAVLTGMAGITIGYLTAVVSDMDCYQGGQRPATQAEYERFKNEMCRTMVANGMKDLPKDCY